MAPHKEFAVKLDKISPIFDYDGFSTNNHITYY